MIQVYFFNKEGRAMPQPNVRTFLLALALSIWIRSKIHWENMDRLKLMFSMRIGQLSHSGDQFALRTSPSVAPCFFNVFNASTYRSTSRDILTEVSCRFFSLMMTSDKDTSCQWTLCFGLCLVLSIYVSLITDESSVSSSTTDFDFACTMCVQEEVRLSVHPQPSPSATPSLLH